MGVVVKTRIEEYWSTTANIFCTPGFGKHMSINRFLLISKLLHFANNEDMCSPGLDVSEARLFKIKPVLSHLNNKFQSLYKMAQNIALDESLLQWKGWLDINQLVPNKAAVMGIKSYEICESQTGYLWRFEIQAHKKSPQQQPEEPLNASTPSIVLRLTHGLENKGYTLWMDNFYNSPSLARRLKASGIHCVGTLRTNRQFVPRALHDLTKRNMRKSQITGLTSGDVDVMVWKDVNRVAMISTYHGNAVKQVRESTKPILILDYNIMMGGVDKKDQMLAMYPIERKRTRVWYKKLFRRLLNVSVLNSFIIHRHSSTLTHRNFRIKLS
ncbi:piggyBac transposable element-derived protein 4-like [Aricia agestis]|uniref:piggyBac transposable element-derived protein 4-like n=1 Tax=Aricia agestis TaxID=91739 RepID=UPI001C204AA1|nr:piggyBac transposable element-derived protein 4-like [Aricia agestis]